MRPYLFFVCAHQFFVFPVLQLSWSFSNGQRCVEDKQLSCTVCSLTHTDQPSAFMLLFYILSKNTGYYAVYHVINNFIAKSTRMRLKPLYSTDMFLKVLNTLSASSPACITGPNTVSVSRVSANISGI